MEGDRLCPPGNHRGWYKAREVFSQGLTRKLPGRLHPGLEELHGKREECPVCKAQGEPGAHSSFVVFAEPGSQLENRLFGVLQNPRALLFEGSLLPGQRGAVMDSGSLQSSVLLLLPRITYARLASTRQVTCTGRLQGSLPLLLQGWWCCLGN